MSNPPSEKHERVPLRTPTPAALQGPAVAPLSYDRPEGWRRKRTDRQGVKIQTGLAHRTASAFAWLMANTAFQKIVNMGGQVVLAWLLSPDDFGLVGMASTVVIFVNLMREAGIIQVLIHRAQRFERWATAGFWMSLSLSIVSGAVLFAIAPLAAQMFHEPQVKGLIWAFACGSPIFALGTVPAAKLQSDMRFGFLTLVGALSTIVTMGLSVLMAWRGYGAYSFVWPMVIVGAARVVVFWWATRPRIRMKLQLRRWRHLFTDSGYVFLATLFYTIVLQGDYFILGLMHTKEVVGQYYLAFNLSMQTLLMLSYNLSQVLFPALSKLQGNRAHQTGAFVRSARQLALIGVPLCLLQVALADPIVRILFQPKWFPAIPVLQVLSMGMTLRVAGMPAAMLVQAQGRFKLYMWLALVSSILFLAMTFTGAVLGAAVSVAVAVAIYYATTDIAYVAVALRDQRGGWRDAVGNVARIYVGPVTASVAAVGLALLVSWGLTRTLDRGRMAVQIALITVISLPTYWLLIRRMMPEASDELIQRAKALTTRAPRD